VVRVRLFQRPEEVVTLVSLHHIAIDFASLAVLLEELGAVYAGRALPPLTATYEDFARWQAEMLAGPRGEELWSFWRGRLAGAPPSLTLPTDRPRPRVQTFRGATRDLVLGPEVTRGLKGLAAAAGVSLSTLVLTAFQALLHRMSGQQDVLVGVPAPGRALPELAEVVGFFVNTVVVRGDFSGAPSFRTALSRMQGRVAEALAHQDFPFPLLAERLHAPLIQVFFVLYQGEEERVARLLTGQAGATLELGDLRLEPWPLAGRAAMFDLSLLMGDAGDRITASFQYNSDLFDDATVDRLTDDFAALLEAVQADPERPVDSLPASLGEARTVSRTEISPASAAAGPEPLERAQDRAEARRALLERQKRIRSSTQRNRE
jgi:hypothetical protein